MNYFLCGFSGAGKSFLLKQIENSFELKNYTFIDLDFQIDQKFAHEFNSLGAMIESKGMEEFRKIELNEIKALAQEKNLLLALGGGALNEQTKSILDQSFKGLWVDTAFETCFNRIKDDSNRPLVKKGESYLSELYQERLSFYQEYPRVQDSKQVIEIIKG